MTTPSPNDSTWKKQSSLSLILHFAARAKTQGITTLSSLGMLLLDFQLCGDPSAHWQGLFLSNLQLSDISQHKLTLLPGMSEIGLEWSQQHHLYQVS